MIDGILGLAGKLVDRLWQDPEKRDAAKLELFKMQQAGELQELAAQWDINKIEAASSDRFASRWRPALGWVCVSAFATQFFIGPMGSWIASFFGKQITFPSMDMTTFMPILLGMLGLAGYRTYEKVNGSNGKEK